MRMSPETDFEATEPPTSSIRTSPETVCTLGVAGDVVDADVPADRLERGAAPSISPRTARSPDAVRVSISRSRPSTATSAEAVATTALLRRDAGADPELLAAEAEEAADLDRDPERLLAAQLDDETVALQLDGRLLDELLAALDPDDGLLAVGGLDHDVAGRDGDLELDRGGGVEAMLGHVGLPVRQADAVAKGDARLLARDAPRPGARIGVALGHARRVVVDPVLPEPAVSDGGG